MDDRGGPTVCPLKEQGLGLIVLCGAFDDRIAEIDMDRVP